MFLSGKKTLEQKWWKHNKKSQIQEIEVWSKNPNQRETFKKNPKERQQC